MRALCEARSTRQAEHYPHKRKQQNQERSIPPCAESFQYPFLSSLSVSELLNLAKSMATQKKSDISQPQTSVITWLNMSMRGKRKRCRATYKKFPLKRGHAFLLPFLSFLLCVM